MKKKFLNQSLGEFEYDCSNKSLRNHTGSIYITELEEEDIENCMTYVEILFNSYGIIYSTYENILAEVSAS